MERAARIHECGPPEVLRVEPIDAPLPGSGEALIRHTAIGLNFVEVYFRRGTFQAPKLPAVLGNEGAGIVEAVGPGVIGVGDGLRNSSVNYSHFRTAVMMISSMPCCSCWIGWSQLSAT